MQKKMISIKGIVKKYGIPYSTINHYTMIGLLTVVKRMKNIRMYDEREVKERLTKIEKLRSKGYPLHLIQRELNNN